MPHACCKQAATAASFAGDHGAEEAGGAGRGEGGGPRTFVRRGAPEAEEAGARPVRHERDLRRWLLGAVLLRAEVRQHAQLKGVRAAGA